MITSIAIRAREIKDTLSLVDLLSRLGYEPVKIYGKERKYLSMLRDSDTTPSFSVDENLGVWYDHGLGKGGNIIDFGLAYWRLPFPETLEKIVQVCGADLPRNNAHHVTGRKRSAVKIPNYKIEDIKPLGNNTVITAYLQYRGIWEVAKLHLKEVYYFIEDQKKQRKYFFAAGWQNELGSWEVRNKHFQASLGHKAISFIPGHEDRLVMFEGFLNYLSWRTENPLQSDSVIVLNSISLLQMGIKKARDFGEIGLFFDRDKSGHTATLELIRVLPQAVDHSAIYDGYNDYNDKLRADQKQIANTISR